MQPDTRFALGNPSSGITSMKKVCAISCAIEKRWRARGLNLQTSTMNPESFGLGKRRKPDLSYPRERYLAHSPSALVIAGSYNAAVSIRAKLQATIAAFGSGIATLSQSVKPHCVPLDQNCISSSSRFSISWRYHARHCSLLMTWLSLVAAT